MQEIEVKILEVEPTLVEAKIRALGAAEKFRGLIATTLWDHPDRRLQQAGHLLRLRTVGEQAYLCFKEFVPHETAKVRIEHETPVGDFAVARRILQCAGFIETLVLEKERRLYRLEDAEFAIDIHQGAYGGIPPLLEIEAPDAKRVFDLAARLGYAQEDCKNWGVSQLLAHYGLSEGPPQNTV